MSRFSVKIVLFHSTEKFRRGTLYCVTNFGYRKILCFRGLCHDFLSKLFCFTAPKNSVGEPFIVSLISGIENFMLQRVMSRFSVENFLSHSAENFRRGILWCVTIAGIEKFYASEGYVTIFCRIFLSHSAGKFRRGTLLCCVSENFR